MSVSAKRRQSELHLALTTLVAGVGDRWIGSVVFRPSLPPYRDWLNTTWLELESAGLVDHNMSSLVETKYQLTPLGWRVGLRVSGALTSPHMTERSGRLAAALKSYVKGRAGSHEALAAFTDIVRSTQLPEGWVFNALTAALLEEMFPAKRMQVRLENSISPLVWIPPTFGLPHVEIPRAP
jgi:hypothetical protein